GGTTRGDVAAASTRRSENRGSARRNGRRARQPDLGDAAGDVVPRIARGAAAGAERGVVRHARSDLSDHGRRAQGPNQRRSAGMIARRLGPDAIVVKEVMLRDLQLPAEYAKGLEGVLLKEQENDRLSVEVEVKQKQVRTAELEAQADKARQVTGAEAQAQVTV